ncbi:hypothetical protein U9M48_001781 [Paspalum notatum var. saurae]|uniref:Uncharacterized protein n=1 Tax=Paspalum notatum var. saurae TaxID=547442 RepID=A0AAQ3SJ99_PASNO
MITQDEVDLLKDLPILHTLCLCFKEFHYNELRFKGISAFRQLQVLEITCNVRLKPITFEPSVMGRLKVLKIHCSNNVSSLKCSGLKELPKLKEVSLSGSYGDKIKNDLKSLLDELPNEMKPVLKLD